MEADILVPLNFEPDHYKYNAILYHLFHHCHLIRTYKTIHKLVKVTVKIMLMLFIYCYQKLNEIKNNIHKNLLHIGKKIELIMYM